MTLEEREKNHKSLMNSWDRLRVSEDDFVSHFYEALFKERPDLKSLFNDDLTVQKLKFTEMVNMLINSLNYLDHLVPTIQQLGHKHVEYGVEIDDYDVVIEVFLNTLQTIPIEISNEEIDAW